MVQASRGLHHYHLRKRICVENQPYPHPDKFKNFLDKAIYFVGMFGPIMSFPQIWKIWYYKEASGVSALSWSAYMVTASFWIMYGVAHKEKPIIVINSVWIVLEFMIVLGAILYG